MIDPKTLPVLKPGSRGKAVSAAKMAVNQANGKGWNTTAFYGPLFKTRVTAFQKAHHLTADGVIGEKTWAALIPHLTLPAQLLLKPVEPPLVKPKQGWGSLVEDLWRPYTQGRNVGLTDLGTYNPASKLPSGRPSDHATSRIDGKIGPPACAFDLGFTKATRSKASAFFTSMTLNPAVEYVIMENRIWSRDLGLHTYTHGGHETHVHVSGRRR